MGQVAFSGLLTAGPNAGSDVFPSSSFSVPLSFGDGNKQFGTATGVLTKTLASALAYVTLDGVGASSTVTAGALLYFKTRSAMLLRLTTDDGNGGTEQAEVPVQGILVIEFPTDRPLELLEAQGEGLVEYFVCGAV